MKLLFLIFSLTLFAFSALAQVDNRTETNCDGEMRSIYGVGEEGRPLIIAAKGLDCSICMNQAPNVGNFAETYNGQIEVWAGMTNLYNPDDPTCPEVADWESDYSWTNIFTFLDLPQYWMTGGGLPDYHVIHPQTHEVVYTGSSWSAASNAAIELLSLNISNQSAGIQKLLVSADPSTLKVWIESTVPGELQLEVVTIVGQQIAEYSTRVASGAQNLEFPLVANEGVYLLRVFQNGQPSVRQFAVR